jgi:hypothetical protein
MGLVTVLQFSRSLATVLVYVSFPSRIKKISKEYLTTRAPVRVTRP